jgi:hypothetical protein
MATLNVNYSVTGTCSNGVGSVQILPQGGIPPYSYQWLNPEGFTGSFLTGLGGGEYTVIVNDSQAPENNVATVNVSISSGMCLTVMSVSGTTCGLDNGVIQISATTDNIEISYSLIDSSGNTVNIISENSFVVNFDGISAGTYNVTAVNLGGCSATTESIIIGSGSPVNFGFYVVNDTECDVNPSGKLYLTGLTGNGPFNYLWTNGDTGTTITGLTAGLYGCTVTSSDYCVTTNSALVDFVPSLGLGSWSAITPTCFANNGSLILTITGGTGPYYYSGSNGSVFISYSQTQSFTNLTSGPFSVSVTDATFCKQTFSTNLGIVNSISLVEVLVNDSVCSLSGGSVTLNVIGGTPPYNYSITGSTGIQTISSNSSNYIFNNLVSGNYIVGVVNVGECSFYENVTITNIDKFTTTINVTGSTCNLNNGIIQLVLSSGGTPPYTYSLSNGFTTQTTNTTFDFNGLPSGTYTYQVEDIEGCSQTGLIFVEGSQQVNFELFPINCIGGVNGSITVLISSGTPPFTFTWSNNLPSNPQEVFITGLTKGEYTLSIVDSNQCSYSASTNIDCFDILSSFQVYGMTSTEFSNLSGSKRGMLEMMNEGYQNLISGLGGCILSATTFTIETEISGVTYSSLFYSGVTLLDIPTDEDYYTAVQNLLNPLVLDLTINEESTEINVQLENNPPNTIFKVDLIIDYIINCFPTPTPSTSMVITPSVSPTPTTTPSVTPTN